MTSSGGVLNGGAFPLSRCRTARRLWRLVWVSEAALFGLCLLANPAFCIEAGDGGRAGFPGSGDGGLGSAIGPGGSGAAGGGGGAGRTGGSGGPSGTIRGGQGATTPGGDGGQGQDGVDSSDSAGGGGGGAHGAVVAIPSANSGTLAGGNGGQGGNGANGGGAGSAGGGGGGGFGVVVDGAGLVYANNGTISGGSGGAGGASFTFNGAPVGGGGGSGGFGVFFNGAGATLSNTGSIAGGIGGRSNGDSAGVGGAGVAFTATGSTLSNSGTIAGGNGGNASSSSSADAGLGGAGVSFTAPGNTLSNSGTITGGNGGSRCSTSPPSGGPAIIGPGLSVTNSGAITGGLGGTSTTCRAIPVLTGDGVATRANAITFTGGVNSLTLAAGSAIVGNVVAFSAADTLAFGGSANSSFDLSTLGSQYVGFGLLAKTGTSTWTLTGNGSSFAGTTTISAGTLIVGPDGAPDASLGGTVIVQGGTLSGLGTVGALNNTGGIVAPGGSIGSLAVGGNYSQSAGGTLQIKVSPAAASQLKVGGAARLGGTLALVYAPGVYTPRSYTLVQAASLSGSFAQVTSNLPPSGLTQTVAINPADVQLQLGGTVAQLQTVGPSSDTLTVAPTNDTLYTAAASTLVMNGQRVNSILLDRLDARQAGIADAAAAASDARGTPLRLAQSGNIAALGSIASVLPQALASEGAWFRGIGDFASVSGNAAAPGFTGASGGFLAGFDRPIVSDLYLGLAAGYVHSDLSERSAASGQVDSGRVAVYGGGWLGPNLFTGTAGYAYDRISTARNLSGVGTAAQAHNGHEFSIAGQWSLPIPVAGIAGTAVVTPKIGVQFLHLTEDGFTETGADGFDLTSRGNGTDSVQPYLGLAAFERFVAADGTEITPEIRLGYNREVLSNNRVITLAAIDGTAFSAPGVKPSRDMLSAGIGVTLRAQDNILFYANYDAILPTGNTSNHTVSAGLRVRF